MSSLSEPNFLQSEEGEEEKQVVYSLDSNSSKFSDAIESIDDLELDLDLVDVQAKKQYNENIPKLSDCTTMPVEEVYECQSTFQSSNFYKIHPNEIEKSLDKNDAYRYLSTLIVQNE